MKAPLFTILKSLSATAKENARERVLRLLSTASRMRGADCLNPNDTAELCRSLGYEFTAGEPTTFETGGGIRKLEVMRCGVVRVNAESCLYTDLGNRAATLDFAKPSLKIDHALAVWSHRWLGFHHYLTELFPKICKLRETMGEDLGGAKICYPMIHRRYEKDLLDLLKLPKEQVIDCYGAGGVVADRITVVPMAGWFGGNPNANLLREQFLSTESSGGGPELLYLTRSGRRRCLNDEPLIERCKALGFETIDESSRSIRDQMELFKNARILIGPHGSAFSNMVWARPGVHVIEMMPTTFDVAYHRELTKSLGHRYTKISCENGCLASTGVTIDYQVNLDQAIRTAEAAVADL